jgi:AraC family transcriptional activator of pobA
MKRKVSKQSNHQEIKPIIVKNISEINGVEFNSQNRKDYFRVLLFRKGNGKRISIDLKEYLITDFTIFIISPGQLFYFDQNNSNTGLFIKFTKEFLSFSVLPAGLHWFLKFYINSKIILSTLQFDKLYSYFEQIGKVFHSNSIFQLKKSQKFLGLAFFELIEHIPKKSDFNAKEGISYQFMSLVLENLYNFRLVKNYAELLHLNLNRLEKEIKDHYGKSPSSIINELLVIEIKRLLLIGKQTHKEIAFTLNFDSQSSYSRFIKLHTGLTPTALKNDLNAQYQHPFS